jgi:hypothetical protein
MAKRSIENVYCDGRGSIRSCLNNGRRVISVGICNNSYYSFLNFKNINTMMGVAPKYNAI